MREYLIKGKTLKKGWITNYTIPAKTYSLAIEYIEENTLNKEQTYCLIQIKTLHL